MAISKLLLECPYCHSPIEADPPNGIRSAYSLEPPIRGNFYGNVIKQTVICANPKCKRTMEIYWYAPLTYFDRF